MRLSIFQTTNLIQISHKLLKYNRPWFILHYGDTSNADTQLFINVLLTIVC